jgi:hypothetical protein
MIPGACETIPKGTIWNPTARAYHIRAGLRYGSDLKTTEADGPRGYDAGKEVTGRKRHALVGTDGRGLELLVHPVGIGNRGGALPLLKRDPSVRLAVVHPRHWVVERTFAWLNRNRRLASTKWATPSVFAMLPS